MKTIPLFALIFTLIASLATSVLAGEPQAATTQTNTAAAELVGLLQQAQTLKGEFEQHLYDREGHLLQTTEGRFTLQRPGNFYWETLPPYEQIVVGNSKKLWIYDPDLEQVTVRQQTEQSSTSPAKLLSGEIEDLTQHYQISREVEGEHKHFNLVSLHSDGMFASLQLTYRQSTLVALTFEDTMGQVTKLSFSDVELNPTVDPDVFQFEAPQGVDVIVDG